MTAAELLRRRADDYKTLGEEHGGSDPALLFPYRLIETCLRDVADAIEQADQ